MWILAVENCSSFCRFYSDYSLLKDFERTRHHKIKITAFSSCERWNYFHRDNDNHQNRWVHKLILIEEHMKFEAEQIIIVECARKYLRTQQRRQKNSFQDFFLKFFQSNAIPFVLRQIHTHKKLIEQDMLIRYRPYTVERVRKYMWTQQRRNGDKSIVSRTIFWKFFIRTQFR